MTARARSILAAVLFIASIGLNAHTFYRAWRPRAAAESPPIAFLKDPVELAAAEHDVAGTYITGERYGDRMIVIEPAGRIRFFELGGADTQGELGSYRVGRLGKKLVLAVHPPGVIEVVSLDTLNYCEDRYTRTATPPSPSAPTAPPSGKKRAPRVAMSEAADYR